MVPADNTRACRAWGISLEILVMTKDSESIEKRSMFPLKYWNSLKQSFLAISSSICSLSNMEQLWIPVILRYNWTFLYLTQSITILASFFDFCFVFVCVELERERLLFCGLFFVGTERGNVSVLNSVVL